MPLIQVGVHVTSCMKCEEIGSLLMVVDLNVLLHFADPRRRHNFESSLKLSLVYQSGLTEFECLNCFEFF